MKLERFNAYGLDVLKRSAKDKSDDSTAVILLHGYGANFEDLVPLANYLADSDSDIDFYFPDAPFEIPMFPFSGKAWFPIDMDTYQRRLMEGTGEDYFKGEAPKELSESTEKVFQLIESLTPNYKKVILGGFSQGSMIALNTYLTKDLKLSALILFSGALACEKEWTEHASKLKEIPIFQSHGFSDPVLPYPMGLKLKNFIAQNSGKHLFTEFGGGHEIPLPVLSRCKSFLYGAVNK